MFTPPAKAASSTEAPTSQLTNNFLGTTLEDAAASENRSLLAEAAGNRVSGKHSPAGRIRAETGTGPPIPTWEERGARLKQGRKLNALASRLMQQKRFGEAVVVFKDAVQAFPTETNDLTYGEALYNLGHSLRVTGNPDQAIPVLSRALRFPPYRTAAFLELRIAQNQAAKAKSRYAGRSFKN